MEVAEGSHKNQTSSPTGWHACLKNNFTEDDKCNNLTSWLISRIWPRICMMKVRLADAQADLSLRWAHMPFCWFCQEAAHLQFNNDVCFV